MMSARCTVPPLHRVGNVTMAISNDNGVTFKYHTTFSIGEYYTGSVSHWVRQALRSWMGAVFQPTARVDLCMAFETDVAPTQRRKKSTVSMALANHKTPPDVDVGADVCQNVQKSPLTRHVSSANPTSKRQSLVNFTSSIGSCLSLYSCQSQRQNLHDRNIDKGRHKMSFLVSAYKKVSLQSGLGQP